MGTYVSQLDDGKWAEYAVGFRDGEINGELLIELEGFIALKTHAGVKSVPLCKKLWPHVEALFAAAGTRRVQPTDATVVPSAADPPPAYRSSDDQPAEKKEADNALDATVKPSSASIQQIRELQAEKEGMQAEMELLRVQAKK